MRKGHADAFYLDWILLGSGAFLFFQGSLQGALLAAFGLFIHFAMGGFETEF